MELDLKDKVIVVTGASKGIGLAVVKVLAREGARIVAGSRTTTSELTGLRDMHDLTLITVDLATANVPISLIDAAAKRHGKIDVLINNVGIASPRSGFLDISDDEWQRVFKLTFFSAVRATRAALPHLVASRGAIVNVGSINARLPFPMVVDYSAAKAALSNLSKALSEEFAPRGVRVNVVAPGPVRTGRIQVGLPMSSPLALASAPKPRSMKPYRAIWESLQAALLRRMRSPTLWPTLLRRVLPTLPAPNSSSMAVR